MIITFHDGPSLAFPFNWRKSCAIAFALTDLCRN